MCRKLICDGETWGVIHNWMLAPLRSNTIAFHRSLINNPLSVAKWYDYSLIMFL